MKWRIENVSLDSCYAATVEEETPDGYRRVVAVLDDGTAARAVADHNACERFADPEKAIELLMEFVGPLASDFCKVRVKAGELLAHPALQPPKEKT